MRRRADFLLTQSESGDGLCVWSEERRGNERRREREGVTREFGCSVSNVKAFLTDIVSCSKSKVYGVAGVGGIKSRDERSKT